MERAGTDFSAFSAMDPADVAREGLANLAEGPIWVAGEANRVSAECIRRMSPGEAVVALSASSATTFGRQR
jgi:hypothetical protein